MRAVVSFLIACGLSSGAAPAQPASELVLDGVIVAANPADSIALVRRSDGNRARPLRVGGEFAGYVLVEVSRDSARLSGPRGGIRIGLGAGGTTVAVVDVEPPPESEFSWVRRSFSRAEANERLEKEIPVILSDTEVTPRVVEGEVKGLELLRLPDGTVLSRSGLLPGDVLRSINEEPLSGLDSLWRLLARFADDDELRVVIERRGEVVRFAYNLTNGAASVSIVARLRRVVDYVITATVNFHRDGCFDRATVIAYFGLLSFLPLAVFLVSIAALALGTDAAERGTTELFSSLLYRMPPQLMTQVRSLQSEVWSGAGYLVLVLWTASKVFSKIESGMDRVFRVDERRHFARRKLFAFGLVGLMSVLLVAMVVMEGVMSAVDRFIDTTALAPLKDQWLYQMLDMFVARTVLPWALTMLAFFIVYWLVPATSVPWRVALVGGAVAGTLWTLAKVGFTYYISHVANYTRTYGALATLIVFLLWINLSASLLLWGGELAAAVGGSRSRSS